MRTINKKTKTSHSVGVVVRAKRLKTKISILQSVQTCAFCPEIAEHLINNRPVCADCWPSFLLLKFGRTAIAEVQAESVVKHD